MKNDLAQKLQQIEEGLKTDQPLGVDLDTIDSYLEALATGKIAPQKEVESPSGYKKLGLSNVLINMGFSVIAIVIATSISVLYLQPILNKLQDEIKVIEIRIAKIEAIIAATSTPIPVTNFSLELKANPTSIPANGVDHSQIVVLVRDQSGNLAPNGTEVVFDPPQWGKLDSMGPLVTINGQTQTTFIAGNMPAPENVAIVAKARVPGGALASTFIQVTEMVSPNLQVNIQANPSDRELNPGEPISFVFLISNNGNAPATGVTLFSYLPKNVSLDDPASYLLEDGGVKWNIGDIQPSNLPVERTLTVRVNNDLPKGSTVLSPKYLVESGNTQSINGQEGQFFSLSVSVQPVKPVATTIRLTTPDNNTTLTANGQNQIRITAEILDQNEISFDGRVEFKLVPSGLGELTIDPNTPNVATFTVGTTPGEVKIVATSGDAVGEITLTLILPTYRFGNASVLYGNPSSRISTLPKGTPILDIVGPLQENGYRKIAVAIWIPKKAISNTTIRDVAAQVRVGKIPEDPLNSDPLPTLLSGASEEPFEILDDSRDDFTQIKVLGWIKGEYVEKIE